MSDAYYRTFDPSFGLNTKNNLDFFSFQSPEILAPHPDLLDFESEIDNSVALFDEDLQTRLLTVDSPENYNFYRSQPSACGPPSTITSSESTSYDNRSEAFFSAPTTYSASNYSFPLDFESLDLNNIPIESDFGAVSVGITLTPPAPAIDPSVTMGFDNFMSNAAASSLDDILGEPTYVRPPRRPAYSDYSGIAPSKRQDYLNPADMLGLETSLSQFSPSSKSSPISASSPSSEPEDPRKKHKCSICSRAFARAFNLKTHMATHDPKREKPYVCHHFPCDRSFSRKHDLGRHLVSIHNDTSLCPTRASKKAGGNITKSVGVARGARGWCESCGKGWIGKQADCDCNDDLFK